MTTRLLRACGGKSHSWLTPTTSRSKPSANRISVAEGSKETIRMGEMYHTRTILGATPRTLRLGVQLTDRVRVAHQHQKLLRIEFLRIQFLEDGRDLDSHAHRAHRLTIGDAHADSSAALAGVESGDRNKRLILELHASQMSAVQRGGHFVAVHPWRAEFLERSFRPAAHRNTGALQDFDS